MAMESLYPEIDIPDIKEDKKSAAKVEQYRISKKAVYLPKNQYLPLSAVEKMQIRHSMMNTKGCCGLSFPVHNVILFVKDKDPVKLMCEKERNALAITEMISTSNPDIILEEYIPPHKEKAL